VNSSSTIALDVEVLRAAECVGNYAFFHRSLIAAPLDYVGMAISSHASGWPRYSYSFELPSGFDVRRFLFTQRLTQLCDPWPLSHQDNRSRGPANTGQHISSIFLFEREPGFYVHLNRTA
jgi:hypothetical protein